MRQHLKRFNLVLQQGLGGIITDSGKIDVFDGDSLFARGILPPVDYAGGSFPQKLLREEVVLAEVDSLTMFFLHFLI